MPCVAVPYLISHFIFQWSMHRVGGAASTSIAAACGLLHTQPFQIIFEQVTVLHRLMWHLCHFFMAFHAGGSHAGGRNDA